MQPLVGQQTMLGCWEALARLSAGARLVRPSGAVAAVFPRWAPLNNAILLDAVDPAREHQVASAVRELFDGAGVTSWAFWRPSEVRDLDQPDVRPPIEGLIRDIETLVMSLEGLPRGLEPNPAVVKTSIADATRAAGDEAVPPDHLAAPDGIDGLDGWVIVHDGLAVAGAWSYLFEGDCGIYTVGTMEQWRRRGLARALILHVLSDAQSRGARTASLQSTRMGRPLYESLGFTAVGRYEEWVPASDTGPSPGD